MKTCTILLAGLFSLVATHGMAASVMAPVVSENLNGDEVWLPAGLPQARNVLILAFQREQQANVDGWVDGMALRQSPLSWLELPVIENPGALGRWFINSGMRSGVLGEDARAHVVSLYLDKGAFLSSLAIDDERTVYVVVVDQAGHVIEKIKGDYTPAAAKKIWQAMVVKP